jgi:hypothetical protein
MTVAVVDALEMIEIEHEQRHRFSILDRVVQQSIEFAGEGLSVHGAGQGILHRHLLELLGLGFQRLMRRFQETLLARKRLGLSVQMRGAAAALPPRCQQDQAQTGKPPGPMLRYGLCTRRHCRGYRGLRPRRCNRWRIGRCDLNRRRGDAIGHPLAVFVGMGAPSVAHRGIAAHVVSRCHRHRRFAAEAVVTGLVGERNCFVERG